MILKTEFSFSAIICLFILSFIADQVNASTKAEEEKFQLAKSYLCRYGYLPKNVCFYKVFRANDFLSKHSDKMRTGLILFQKMFNLTETGKINTNSIVKMGMPRCGNEDLSAKPLKDTPYIDYSKLFHEGNNEITYSLRNFNFYSKDISKTVTNAFIDTNIQNAFQAWFKYLNANITVRKIRASYEYFKNTPRGNVTFMFGEGRHGDAMPFDAENGELSHAATLSSDSIFRGQIHLDDEEDWSTENKLFSMLVHEIGHLFGLNHSSNANSIMAPIVKTKREQLLDPEDIVNLERALGLSLAERKTGNQSNVTDNSNEKQDNAVTIPVTTVITTSTTVKPTTVRTVNKKLSYLEQLINELKALTGKVPSTTATPTTIITTPSTTTTTSTTTSTTSAPTTMAKTTTFSTTTTASTISTYSTTEFMPPEDRPIETIIDDILRNRNKNGHAKSKIQQEVTSEPAEKKNSFSAQDTEYEYLLRLLGAPAKLIMSSLPFNSTKYTITSSSESNSTTEIPISAATTTSTTTTTTTMTTTTTKSTTTEKTKIATNLISPRQISSNNTELIHNIYKQQQIHESKKLFFEQFCKQPNLDALTRTEWGNVFVFKGDMIWHIRGLTKWSIVDYEGWPKKISSIFPGVPEHINSAFFLENHYYFTKGELIWKFSISKSYNTHYEAVAGYPRSLNLEFPHIPYKSVDSAFSSGSSVFFFKDFSFWQSAWNVNITYPMPFKTIAALSWKQPGLVFDYSEPLAYLVSGVTMHQFDYWNINLQKNNVDIRYFLFDCLETNPKPDRRVFIGPTYSHT